MKVLLVDALASGSGRRRSSIDVIGAGPRQVAGILEMFGIEYRLVTAEEALRSKAREFDVLMVSAMTMDASAARRLAARHRRAVKVLGGPITNDPTVVSRLGYDFGIWGEGEASLARVIEVGGLSEPGRLTPEIPNLLLNRGGKVVAGPRRRLTPREFNSFFPSTEALRHYRFRPHYRYARVYVEVERSCSNFIRPAMLADRKICDVCGACLGSRPPLEVCPQGIPPGCGYCSIPATFGPPKSKDASNVVREIESLVALGVQRIILSGADFLDYGRDREGRALHPCEPGPNLGAVEDLLRLIASIPQVRDGRVYVGIENVKPCLLTDEAISLLSHYLPNPVIHVGIETGDDSHARILGRPCSSTLAEERARAAAEAGLRIYAYFIHGLPGQSMKTARATVEMMERLYRAGVEKFTVYRFKPLPGSAFESLQPGPPAREDRASALIESTARRLNVSRKREMVGKRLEVIFSPDFHRGARVAYPISEGPTCLVRGAPKSVRVGDRGYVLVTGLVSDRALLAEFLNKKT